jgi:hypothetical protein
MTNYEIQSEYPHVFDNEFNSRKIIGEIPRYMPVSRGILDIKGGAVATDTNILLTKDKNGKKEWVVFFKMRGNPYGTHGYSFINQEASFELNKMHLNLKINAKPIW